MQHLDDSYVGNGRDKGVVVSKAVPIRSEKEENRDTDVEARH